MAKETLKDLPTDLLRKRKRNFSILVVLMIAPLIINGLLYIYLLVGGKGADVSLLIPAMSIFVIAIPVYGRLKAVEEELERRKEA